MTRLVITRLAENDLEEIGDYIALDNPRRALSFVAELRSQCNKIGLSPQTYRLRTELGIQMHSCAYGNYVIFFTHDERITRIIRILHSARDITAIFKPSG